MIKIISALDKLFPAPKDGAPGADAVVYTIVCSNTNPNVTNNDVSITLTAYKTVGSNRVKCELGAHLFLLDYTNAKTLAKNPATVVLPKGKTREVTILLADVNAILATCTISPVVNGQNGGVGPMMYYAGEWQTGVSYVRTAQVVPLVSHGSDQFFYYPAKEGTLLNNEPSSSNTAWKQQQKVPLLLAQLLMVDFGKIASAVFCGDYMLSQYGKKKDGTAVDGNSTDKDTAYKGFDASNPEGGAFVPNLLINFLTGLIRAVDMQAIGGSFKDIKATGSFSSGEGEKQISMGYSEEDAAGHLKLGNYIDIKCLTQYIDVGHGLQQAPGGYIVIKGDRDDYSTTISSTGLGTAYIATDIIETDHARIGKIQLKCKFITEGETYTHTGAYSMYNVVGTLKLQSTMVEKDGDIVYVHGGTVVIDRFMDANRNTLETNKTYKLGSASAQFAKMGTYWILFYCG